MLDFSEKLISWYKTEKRDLPWRSTKDPYKIWISEVILQQTRVDQGLPYYLKFLRLFPSVFELASASEEEVLNAWKGLGYYSRARNMFKTAQIVVKELNGVFPSTYNELVKLKGVGDYTASAIASFSNDEQVAVVDGNVYRVLSRVFGVEIAIDSGEGKKMFKKLAQELLSPTKASIHNQAIMEFGALQCVPKNPICENCPFEANCEAKNLKKTSALPFKSKKIKRKSRYFNYLLFVKNEKHAFVKRGDKDIWANMYEFPMIESSSSLEDSELLIEDLNDKYGVDVKELIIEGGYKKHVLSHQDIYYAFWKVKGEVTSGFNYYDLEQLKNIPFPKLIENYFSNI